MIHLWGHVSACPCGFLEAENSGDLMKIGFVQFAPVLGNLDATIGKLDKLLDRCNGADLVVLPELCNSGYNFKSAAHARITAEELGDSRFILFLEYVCAHEKMHIVSGFNEKAGGNLYNSAVLVGPKGVIGTYRKIHLFMNEKDFFKPGDAGLPVFDIGKCRVGMLICFDWIFPEVWRALALKGADVICHPSNLVLPGLAQKAIPGHAITNRVFVITANRIGTERGLAFTGLSVIANPKGDVVAQASAQKEEVRIVEADIALARKKQITPRNDIFGDRRPEEYGMLTKSNEGK
jgi:predicted amidohydrolase